MRTIAIAFTLLALGIVPCHADQTADSLSKSCQLAETAINNATPNSIYIDNPYDTGFCVGYISAMSEARQVKTCVPKGVTISQTVKIFLKWISDHPEKLHLPATVALNMAMQNAYQCGK